MFLSTDCRMYSSKQKLQLTLITVFLYLLTNAHRVTFTFAIPVLTNGHLHFFLISILIKSVSRPTMILLLPLLLQFRIDLILFSNSFLKEHIRSQYMKVHLTVIP